MPAQIGQLESLHQLLLSANELTGQIPTETGGAGGLNVPCLHENVLSGASRASIEL